MLRAPQPRDWQDLEDLCWLLWKRIWNDPYAQKNGRNGQEQNGVDVVGQPSSGVIHEGIQCKHTASLTLDDVTTEVARARNFLPPLKTLIVVTSAPRDAVLQSSVRNLSEESQGAGGFRIVVQFWDDIQDTLNSYREVFSEYLAGHGFGLVSPSENTIIGSGRATAHLLTPGESDEPTLPAIKTASELIQEGHLQAAQRLLTSTRKEKWTLASPRDKYRLLANLGLAYHLAGDNDTAANTLIEALQYNPDSENALTNAATGYILLGKREDARAVIDGVLKRDSLSPVGNALAIQLSDPAADFDVLADRIPEGLKSNEDVAYQLGLAARDRKRFEDGLKHLKVAVANSRGKREFEVTLAETMVMALDRQHPGIRLGILGDTDKTTLAEALALVDRAWNGIKDTDLRVSHADWLGLRSTIKLFLGDDKGAIDDIKHAHLISPTHRRITKLLALQLQHLGKTDEAIDLLKGVGRSIDSSEEKLLLAAMLRLQGKTKEAGEELKVLLEYQLPTRDRKNVYECLFDIAVGSRDISAAESSHNELSAIDGSRIEAALREVQIADLKGDNSHRNALLAEAVTLVVPESPYLTLLELTQRLCDAFQYAPAIPILRRLVPQPGNDFLTLRLVRACWEAGDLQGALETCETLEKQVGYLPLAAEIQSAAYERLGNLPAAERVCSGYLGANPGSQHMALRLAWIHFRSMKLAEVDSYLAKTKTIGGLSETDVLQLCSLFLLRENYPRAVEILYQACLHYPNNSDIQLQFVMAILQGNADIDDLLRVETVGPGVAVALEGDGGKTDWIIIARGEEFEEKALPREMLPPNHPTAQKLLGARVGDIRILREDGLTTESIKVIAIKHQYLHLAHTIQQTFSLQFPSDLRLQSVHVGDPEKLKGLPKEFERALDELDKRRPLIDQWLKMYRSGQLPFGTLCVLLKKNGYEVASVLTKSPDVGIRCCQGGQPERDNAFGILSQNLLPVVDPIALMTIHWIGLQEHCTRIFPKLLVSQSTLDYFRQCIAQMKLFAERQSGFMSKINGRVVMVENDPKQIAQEISWLEGVTSWITEKCQLVAHAAALELPSVENRSKEKILGKASYHSILAAKEKGKALWADDWALRAIAIREFGVPSFWTQAVFKKGLDNGVLSVDEGRMFSLRLAERNYHLTSIDSGTVVFAASQSSWSASTSYRTACEMLSGKVTDDSGVQVAFETIVQLMDAPVTPFQRDVLIQVLLECVLSRRDQHAVMESLIAASRARFRLEPLKARDLCGLLLLLKDKSKFSKSV